MIERKNKKEKIELKNSAWHNSESIEANISRLDYIDKFQEWEKIAEMHIYPI